MSRLIRRKKPPQVEPRDLAGLHWMTAGLFLAAGAEAALGERRGDYRADDAVRWAPFIAAPLAGAAQAARALWPSQTTRMISQMVNGLALGVGAAGLAASVHDSLRNDEFDDDVTIRRRIPSLAPLAFGAVGLLGLMLDADEDQQEETPPPSRKRRPKRIVLRV